MAAKSLWSRDEALILLDALIKTLDGKIERNAAVSAVSLELRDRARKNGVEIDDIFRNTNGISLQMRSMEYILTNGAHGLNKPVRIFQETVDLYRRDPEEFEKLLGEAKGMAAEKSIEDQFAAWLSGKVSPRQLSELYMSFPDIETFCLERKILKKKLFETTDISTIKAVADTVNSSKIFRFKHKKHIGKLSAAIKYYYDFVKEYAKSKEQHNPEAHTVTTEQTEPRPLKEQSDVLPTKEDKADVYTVDFSTPNNLSFTKPDMVSYFGEKRDVDSWTQVYIQLVTFLLEDYPDVFKRLMNQNVNGRGRSDFSNKQGARQMVAAKKITEDFFIETNLSATDIVSKIRRILDICNVDYENVVIRYIKKNTGSTVSPDPRPTPSVPTAKSDSSPSDEREKFVVWMKNAGIAAATVSSYLSAINQCAKALKEYGITDDNLLAVTDASALLKYRDALLVKSDFRKINEQQHNRFRAAFNKFIDYRSSGTPINLPVVPPVQKAVQKSIPKIAIPKFSITVSSAKNPEDDRFDTILRDNFAEGLLPNALRLDKFRMLYEDEFGRELTPDDDQLISMLKKAGSFIDGRIYPKQDKKQNNLIAEMFTEVINALNDGARCVYICCVMERWQHDLATQLNVYNEETLRALLISQRVPGLIITDYVLKATTQKVYPEENVIAVIRESHSGMTYQQLQEILWYIPLDTIKHALVTTPQIVNVDAETYFYAPNFPATPAELQHLKTCMASRIATKGYLVAQDIEAIIQAQCHTIAINTADYKDWAYRNILKYLFRDDFQFGGAVVSEKGKTLEMWQVYRGYCRDRELITLDELKSLKDELGVPIYWDSVMAEMVRINANEFVRRDLVHFDVSATDRVLNEMCPGDYIPLKGISLYLHFPPIEYPWNEFVLESYLQISKAFKLYHVSYANHGAFGVMVRTSSKFEDYQAVVEDMLANNWEWNTTEQALSLIVEKGYQARKRWTNFEQVTQKASLIREKAKAERA